MGKRLEQTEKPNRCTANRLKIESDKSVQNQNSNMHLQLCSAALHSAALANGASDSATVTRHVQATAAVPLLHPAAQRYHHTGPMEVTGAPSLSLQWRQLQQQTHLWVSRQVVRQEVGVAFDVVVFQCRP